MADSPKSEHSDGLVKLIDDGTENNFGEFRTKNKFILKDLALWKYIEEPLSSPPVIPVLIQPTTHCGTNFQGVEDTFTTSGNTAEVKAAKIATEPWLKGNTKTITKIIKAVLADQVHLVQEAVYAKEAWRALCSVYQSGNSVCTASIKTNIMSLWCTTGTDVGQWLTSLQRLHGKLCSIEPDSMTDRKFALTILNLMLHDSNWRNFVSGLQSKTLAKQANSEIITSQ
ncbi:hypothetical protein BD410DRAFT_722679 [Rickenella mellea]|uniref:Uncharacterized protein n=1 Tax=Rickenella mellea TaxID=50990 RepID=A0A4Y7Q714_9AGAM|nr:hypothetical protein BD410DRAFT_722679 [Rickenella mellea]